jgi:acylphosphatase
LAGPCRGGLTACDGSVTPSTERLDARVMGRVHGVGFRYFALREAMALELTGWVANDPDGSVHCVAEGPRERLERLLERLREGPPAAAVRSVSEAWMPATGTFGSFGVRSGGHRGD